MKKFCEDHIKCKEDTEDTWTCTAHLDEGRTFKCPYVETDIKVIDGRSVPVKENGYPCIDYRPLPTNLKSEVHFFIKEMEWYDRQKNYMSDLPEIWNDQRNYRIKERIERFKEIMENVNEN